MPSPRLVLVTRVIALAATTVASLAWFRFVHQDLELLWPYVVTIAVGGSALGLRFLPLLRAAGRPERPSDRAAVWAFFRGVLADSGLTVGTSAVIGEIAVVASGELEVWPMPLFVSALLGLLGVLLGLLVGMIVLGPAWILLDTVVRAVRGRRVSIPVALFAAVLLEVVAFAVVLRAALTSSSDTLGRRGAAYDNIVAVLLGIPVNGAEIGSPELAWVARGLFLLLGVTLIAFVIAARRRARARRRAGSSD
jgi:hypothetical protein